ncbi:MAG TPA: hypothetical protein PKC45_14335 [Gemmatales bacterium]|nr:hypothetical protein [Gemmatales bacterium]
MELEIPALWFLGQLPGLAIAFALGWWWTTPPDYEERVVLGGYRAVEETQRPKRRVGKRKRPKPGTPSES